jgi:hypothetical protein
MCKNVILNTAIGAVLDLPRKALWATAAVTAVFSLEAGLTIVGDSLDLKAVGVAEVYAASGDLKTYNSANLVVGIASGKVKGDIAVSIWVSSGGVSAGLVPAVGGTGDVLKTVGGDAIAYAAEVFKGTTPTPDMIPSGSSDFQAICYTVPGDIQPATAFSLSFNISGAAQFLTTANYFMGTINGGTKGCSDTALGGTYKITASSTAMLLDATPSASCTIGDGANICLLYKLTSTSGLKEAGKNVQISATLKKGVATIGSAAPITVAESKQGGTFSLVPETDGKVFIATSTENKEFTSTDGLTADDNPADDETAYRAANEVTMGYVKFESQAVVDRTGSTAFALGATGDEGTLVIANGQFSASPAGASAGKVYLKNGAASATVENANDEWTATLKLDNTQLNLLTTGTSPIYTPILLRVDGQSPINDTVGGNDPIGTLTVTMGTAKTPISDQPITSSLRRIPFDGKVCTAYNIPSPVGAADMLTIRITNDSDRTGTILGTLYDQDGNAIGTAVDLLTGHKDYTHDSVNGVARSTVVTDPSILQQRETIILTSKNIAEAFGIDPKVGWPGKRYVLKILSTIPRIEVFNLLRNTESVSLQPLSNVSTSAKGVECSPIP